MWLSYYDEKENIAKNTLFNIDSQVKICSSQPLKTRSSISVNIFLLLSWNQTEARRRANKQEHVCKQLHVYFFHAYGFNLKWCLEWTQVSSIEVVENDGGELVNPNKHISSTLEMNKQRGCWVGETCHAMQMQVGKGVWFWGYLGF